MAKRNRQSSMERRKKNAEQMRLRRQDSFYRNREKAFDKISRSKKRQSEEVRKHERISNKLSMSINRQDEERRSQEKSNDRVNRARKRCNEEVRSQEQERDKEAHVERRRDPQLRQSERIREMNRKRIMRLDSAVRDAERERDKSAKASTRSNPVRRSFEFQNIAVQQKRRRNQQTWEQILAEFQKEIRMAPVNPCSSCGCTYYQENTTPFTLDDLKAKGLECGFIDSVICVHKDNILLCRTCKKHILNSRVPKLNLSNGFAFPVQPPELFVRVIYKLPLVFH